MQILWITPYYEPAYVYGGPARSIPALCKALARQDVDVVVFTTNANGADNLDVPLERPLDMGGVQVTYFPRSTRGSYFWSPRLGRATKDQAGEFDLMHVNGVFSYLSRVASDAAHSSGVPFLISPRGMLMPWAIGHKSLKKKSYMRLFERRRIDQAAALVCTDEYEVEGIKRLGIQRPLYLIPNGINTRRFMELPDRGMIRCKLQIPDGDEVILMLGRLHPIKRPDLAAQAFGIIASKYPNSHLVFAGPDEAGLEKSLRKIARQANAGERIHFTGLLDPAGVLQALADADIFLTTSESENFGMAVAEAMSAGLPVVISEKIGISRYVARSEAGRVVSLDLESVANGLACLLKQSNSLHEMGLRARRAAVENFDIAVVTQKMVDCYTEVISGYKVEHPV